MYTKCFNPYVSLYLTTNCQQSTETKDVFVVRSTEHRVTAAIVNIYFDQYYISLKYELCVHV